MYEIERRVLVSFPSLLGLDLSITNEVILLWVAAGATLALLIPVCRRRTPLARGRWQNLIEAIVEFLQKEVVHESIGPAGSLWAPFLLTLFFFILFSNLMGLVPLPAHVKAVTSNLSVTAGLALTVLGVTVLINVRSHGLWGFLRKFWPAGVAWWIAALMVPIEIVSWIARPISLAIRLFVNMMVGHQLLLLFIGFQIAAAWYLKTLPWAGGVIMSCFELFVCVIQAFVFTMLAGVYIREAMEAH